MSQRDPQAATLPQQHPARFCFIQASWHADIVNQGRDAFLAEMARQGVPQQDIDLMEVPGAFEIPGAIALAADKKGRRYDGYVALGCVIRGETTHYDYVCGESARGLMDLAVQKKLAIGYGIVTVENVEQARARAFTDRGDKGGDAAHACLAMVALGRRWKKS
ncbi:MAG: 6,7-dimethyl-8-ribityllumazine synthase [Polaromonas sp.]|nr:6,7-dimethyl-8-ribityllumazine synthase [Polaromonas sp.]